MYDLLNEFVQQPAPFSRYTTKTLWTDPHIAQQMLAYHLDQSTDLASRKFETIDRIVHWIDGQISLHGKQVCDLGCGPGLYTRRFAAQGARVTGVDFSAYTLDHARTEAGQQGQDIQYIQADYLNDPLPRGFDLVTLIYCDLCVLSPAQRAHLLHRIGEMLNPEGQVVIDVAGTSAFAEKKPTTIIEPQLMGGFWAAEEYLGLQRTFLYPQEKLALDRYLIIQPDRRFEIYNWFQHFTPEDLKAEMKACGFRIDRMVGSLVGEPLTPESSSIGIIARRA